jgi:asparagine synthase (glutamine-hydrolysing)
MCGIIGAVHSNNHAFSINNLERGLNRISNRGPDNTSIYSEKVSNICLHFGHNRLSILDLSEAGSQPMESLDKRYLLVFNGEIYNYKEIRGKLIELGYQFKSTTDSEVLLNAWIHYGKSSVELFTGMFSFVIYDRLDSKLFMARDPFGIKPLYYYQDSSLFCFSSEIDSLLELSNDRELDIKVISTYLFSGVYDNSTATFYRKVRQLDTGCVAIFDLNSFGNLHVERYWKPSIITNPIRDTTELVNIIKEKILKSISLHIRSDVPIGAALSGGLDSSSIVCCLRYLYPDLELNTFSYIATDSNKTEEKWIDIVNNHVGAISHKSYITNQDIVQNLDDFILSQGEPVGGTSFFAEYSVYKLAKEKGIKVMLDGHGADELFAGYLGYPVSRLNSYLQLGQIHKALYFLYNWICWPNRNLKMGLNSLAESLSNTLFNFSLRDYINTSQCLNSDKFNLYHSNYRDTMNDIRNVSHVFHDKPVGRSLTYKLRDELSITSCPYQLRSADRSAMRRSIENRVPFLERDLVSFALTLPEDLLLSPHGQTKHILRLAMKDIVPIEILHRRDKIGYETPSNLKIHDSKKLITEIVNEAKRFPFLNHKSVESILTSNKNDSSISLNGMSWRLYNFLRWTQLNGTGV